MGNYGFRRFRPKDRAWSCQKDRAWLSWRELVGLLVFVALLGGLVIWTTMALPTPGAELKMELIVPALASARIQSTEPAIPQEAP